MTTRTLARAAATLAAGLALSIAPAAAQSLCAVVDPTRTPLNVHTAPEGEVIGTLKNRTMVRIINLERDSKGRPWVHVASYPGGEPLGWVFRKFIACY